jgi:hypothetical protein
VRIIFDSPSYINTAHVDSGGGGGFGVGIVIGSDRGGGHFWLAFAVVLPTYFAIMPNF